MDRLERYDWMPETVKAALGRFWSDFGRSLDDWERYVHDTVPGGMAAVAMQRGIEPIARSELGRNVVGRFVPMWNNIAWVVLDDGSTVGGSFEQRSGAPQMTKQQWIDRAIELFGKDSNEWQFRCPACKGVQSIAQVCRESSMLPEDVRHWIHYSCRGRFTADGCNWSLGGLIRIHRLEVVEPDGSIVPVFEFAEA
jgi:hypothetical protein